MQGSSVVGWLLAGLMGVTGLYCLGRLLRPRTTRAERTLDASEALKGLGMAAMALPYGVTRGVPGAVWIAVFGAAAAWSLIEGLRPRADHRGHHLYHGVGHLAMVYMAVVLEGMRAQGAQGAQGMAGMAGSAGVPLLTGALLVFFGGYALLCGVQLIGAPTGGAAGGEVGGPYRSVAHRLVGAPELPHACRMVLGIGMFAMLLSM
jgi:hypothetical protein